jgi:hypothetical protein
MQPIDMVRVLETAPALFNSKEKIAEDLRKIAEEMTWKKEEKNG